MYVTFAILSSRSSLVDRIEHMYDFFLDTLQEYPTIFVRSQIYLGFFGENKRSTPQDFSHEGLPLSWPTTCIFINCSELSELFSKPNSFKPVYPIIL